MNNSTYIFGRLGKGYTQYPLDSNRTVFETCVALSEYEEQMVIVRRGSLMFYTFIHFLNAEHNEYVGISLSISSQMIYQIKPVFSIFEDGITFLAVEGEVLTYSSDGIVHSATSLDGMTSTVRKLDDFLSKKLSGLSDLMRPLPPQSLDVSAHCVKRCHPEIDSKRIFQYMMTYGYVVISVHVEEEYEPVELEKMLNRTMKKGVSIFRTIKQIFR